MELLMRVEKLVPGDIDLTCQASTLGNYVCTIDDSVLVGTPLQERWTFYAPVSPDFKGTMDELKLIAKPGDGYVPERPWCKFTHPYFYELNIFLDCSGYTIFDEEQ